MGITIALFWVYAIFAPEPTVETLYFDVLKNEKIIGELKAVKRTTNAEEWYESFTTINTHLVKEIEIFYHFEVNMINNQLNTSKAVIKVNEKIHNYTLIKKMENKYFVKRNKKRERWVRDKVDYPGILFLFEEPIGIQRSFSEERGVFHKLFDMGNHSYKKINPKGKENFYHYRDGALQSAQIDVGITQFELILRQ